MTPTSILFVSSSFSLDPNNCFVLSNDSFFFFCFQFQLTSTCTKPSKRVKHVHKRPLPTKRSLVQCASFFRHPLVEERWCENYKKNTEKPSTQDNNLPSSAKRSRSARKGKGYGVLADKIRRRAWERDGREAETHTHRQHKHHNRSERKGQRTDEREHRLRRDNLIKLVIKLNWRWKWEKTSAARDGGFCPGGWVPVKWSMPMYVRVPCFDSFLCCVFFNVYDVFLTLPAGSKVTRAVRVSALLLWVDVWG